MLSINTNLSSLIAQRSMRQSTNRLNQAIERMTTGAKINHAKDNAANYSISTNMTTKIGSYNVAEDNCAMGMDLISTAEGTLSQIQDKLQRLRDLQEQASNGTYGEESLNAINAEANALVDEVNRLYSTAEYNGLKLFGADSGSPIATFVNTRSSTTYSKFDDSYILAHVQRCNTPDSEGVRVHFSDGTLLFSKNLPNSGSYDLKWGDLVVPGTYSWDETQGCYLDLNGNPQSIIIQIPCADTGYYGYDYNEELIIYGIENVVNGGGGGSPTPTPTPTPGGGGGGGGGTSTPPTYAPDTILLQVGTSSNWGSQVGVSTNFVLNNVDDLRMIGLDKTTDYLLIIDDMLELVSEKQTHFGAVQNRLESVLDEIIISRDNLISSRSTLRDADIAEVSSTYIKQQILQQASATLLATANQSPSIALQLI